MTMKHEDVDYHQDELLRKKPIWKHCTQSSYYQFIFRTLSTAIFILRNSFKKNIEVEIRLEKKKTDVVARQSLKLLIFSFTCAAIYYKKVPKNILKKNMCPPILKKQKPKKL